MFEFFATIGRAITTLFAYLGNLITGMARVVTLLFQAISLPVGISGFLPPILGAAIMITVSVAVINRLTGSGGGG